MRRCTSRFALVPDRARSVTIAAFAKGLEAGTKFIGGAPGAVPGTEIRMAARLDLARLAAGGKLKVYVSQTFPLAESAAAHRAIMTSHVTGELAVLP